MRPSRRALRPVSPGPPAAIDPAPADARALFWVGWIGASSLLLELLLIRVFDAIVGPAAAYALVGLALFGIALAGVAVALRPELARPRPLALSLSLAVALLFLWCTLRFVPFSVARIPDAPLAQAGCFATLVAVLVLPFFLGALAVVQQLAARRGTGRIYAADLAGSACGPWILPGLLPHLGPAGVMALLAGGQLLAAAAWSRAPKEASLAAAGPRMRRGPAVAARGSGLLWATLGILLLILATSGTMESWDVPSHAEKRSAEETRLREHAELRRWDPVSKIEIVDLRETDPRTGVVVPGTDRKLISYDGGAQSSHIYRFDGDLDALRADLPARVREHFWQRAVVAAHWFHRDQGARVFVAGCAGGQEVTAALLYGAREVVAVDLVGTLIALGREEYATYNGGIFLDPRVRFYQAEARTELARLATPFDIIQVFSYHNSSRVAAGSLALKAFYLQTAETYALCLGSLAPNGILQINQGFFPRVVTTLAAAWDALDRTDLRDHVLVYGRDGVEDHYTILVKNAPWTEEEVAEMDRFLLPRFSGEDRVYRKIEDPVRPEESFLPGEFYQAPLPEELRDRAAYRVDPVTDDNPFSLHLRKGLARIEADSLRFATESEAVLLNQVIPRRIPVPRDTAHLVFLGAAGALLSLVALFAAIRSAPAHPESPARRRRGARAGYFYALGLAFIAVEWVLVQFAMRIIALPIAAFGTALAVVLVGAALGSWSANRLPARLVFPAIVGLGTLLVLVYPVVAPGLWNQPLGLRIALFALLALPLSFFMGFPFPAGLTRLAAAREVAGAWALNGAASVTGSVGAAALFASIGIGKTALLALAVYGLAGFAYLAAFGGSVPGSSDPRAESSSI